MPALILFGLLPHLVSLSQAFSGVQKKSVVDAGFSKGAPLGEGHYSCQGGLGLANYTTYKKALIQNILFHMEEFKF